MAYLIDCKSCSHRFNPNNYDLCPKCKTRPDRGEVIGVQNSTIDSVRENQRGEVSNLDSSARLLVEAQNRTTQAVRSLAITFVAAPIISILLVVGIGLSVASHEIGLVVLSVIAALTISIYLLLSAVNALNKSKIPNYFN